MGKCPELIMLLTRVNRQTENGIMKKTMGMILNVLLMDLNGIESYLPVWLLNVVIIYET